MRRKWCYDTQQTTFGFTTLSMIVEKVAFVIFKSYDAQRGKIGIMLIVVLLSVIITSAVMLSAVMLSIIMLSVVIPSIMAPKKCS